jgi:putative nucleotidyltransferase with HDIG domain
MRGDWQDRSRSETFRNLSNLPPFHPTALRLLTIAIDSDAAFPQFELSFKSDPALAADLLTVANSAEFGFRSVIETIRHALMVLGLERVRSLAFSIAMRRYMSTIPRRQDLQPIWSHSVATAIIAEQLALGQSSAASLLYTAALLHDVGRLGLMLTVGRPYSRMLAEPHRSVDEAMTREQADFGATHCEAGVVLARQWGLPDNLQDCICYHHDFPNKSRSEALYLTQLACRLADSLGFAEVSTDPSPSWPCLPDAFQGCPELDQDRLKDLVARNISALWKQDANAAK